MHLRLYTRGYIVEVNNYQRFGLDRTVGHNKNIAPGLVCILECVI